MTTGAVSEIGQSQVNDLRVLQDPTDPTVASAGVRDVGNDVLRGIAIFSVLFIHTTASWDRLPLNGWQLQAYGFVRLLCGLWLPLFLIVSGYYAGRTDIRSLQDFRVFLKKRLARIFIPYCIWSVVNFLPKYANGQMTLSDLLPGIAFGRLCYPYYFIPVLVKLYLAYPMFCFCVQRRRLIFPAMVVLAFLWLYPASLDDYAGLRTSRMTEWIFRRSVHVDWAFLFFLGITLRRLNVIPRMRDVINPGQMSRVLGALLFVCLAATVMSICVSSWFVVLLAVALFILLNIADQTVLAKRFKAVAFLGTMSYTIYLLHEPALGYLCRALEGVLRSHPFLTLLPLLAFSIGFPIAVHWAFSMLIGKRARLVVG